jgi:hypothetical protein
MVVSVFSDICRPIYLTFLVAIYKLIQGRNISGKNAGKRMKADWSDFMEITKAMTGMDEQAYISNLLRSIEPLA